MGFDLFAILEGVLSTAIGNNIGQLTIGPATHFLREKFKKDTPEDVVQEFFSLTNDPKGDAWDKYLYFFQALQLGGVNLATDRQIQAAKAMAIHKNLRNRTKIDQRFTRMREELEVLSRKVNDELGPREAAQNLKSVKEMPKGKASDKIVDSVSVLKKNGADKALNGARGTGTSSDGGRAKVNGGEQPRTARDSASEPSNSLAID
jgi:hypothetical protein